MSEINKEEFGEKVAEYRKKKGYTQKELAELLGVSNKAVSKWETGNSLPDISLLAPLSEVLDIKMSELLQTEEIEELIERQKEQMRNLVKKFASFKEETLEVKRKKKKINRVIFFLCAAALAMELLLFYSFGRSFLEFPVIYSLLSLVSVMVSVNVWLFIDDQLPKYYNEHLSISHPAGFRKEFLGVRITRNNYPGMIRAIRIWSVVTMLFVPFCGCMSGISPLSFLNEPIAQGIVLLLYFGILFVPVYIIGERYE